MHEHLNMLPEKVPEETYQLGCWLVETLKTLFNPKENPPFNPGELRSGEGEAFPPIAITTGTSGSTLQRRPFK